MVVDVIFLANTVNKEKYEMTNNAISSLWESTISTGMLPNIIVVESSKEAEGRGFNYTTVDKVVVPDEDFGYNRFLNIGLEYQDNTSNWVVIANNDVIFDKDWLLNIFKYQKNNPDVLSMSPRDPKWHSNPDHYVSDKGEGVRGYRVAHEITGWCLVMRKDVIKKCELFDEDFKFWYQDNDYSMSLQKYKIPHALVNTSIVHHLLSGSHDILTDENKNEMTKEQFKVFVNKWYTPKK